MGGMRYKMLPFMYTLLYNAHTTGSTFTNPLFFNFPDDDNTFGLDEQFMLGEAVLVSPALYKGQLKVDAYFPKGYWYDFKDFSLAVDASDGAKNVSLSTPLTSTNVHVRGGHVLPLQGNAMTTTAARTTPFDLVAALCPDGEAQGSLFWDDGEIFMSDDEASVDATPVSPM